MTGPVVREQVAVMIRTAFNCNGLTGFGKGKVKDSCRLLPPASKPVSQCRTGRQVRPGRHVRRVFRPGGRRGLQTRWIVESRSAGSTPVTLRHFRGIVSPRRRPNACRPPRLPGTASHPASTIFAQTQCKFISQVVIFDHYIQKISPDKHLTITAASRVQAKNVPETNVLRSGILELTQHAPGLV